MSVLQQRVLVMRPYEAGLRTAERLNSLGLEAITAPVLRIEPTGEPLPEGPFDAVSLTSAAALIRAAHLPSILKSLPLLAVGERTAIMASEAGFSNIYAAEGERHSLAALAGKVLAGGNSRRILLALGRDHKDDTVALLQAAGVDPVTWIAYAAHAVDMLPEAAQKALQSEQIDIVLHYSRRSAHVACSLVERAGLWSEFSRLTHYVLSDDVAIPLIERGVQRVIASKRPHEDEMLALFTSIRTA